MISPSHFGYVTWTDTRSNKNALHKFLADYSGVISFCNRPAGQLTVKYHGAGRYKCESSFLSMMNITQAHPRHFLRVVEVLALLLNPFQGELIERLNTNDGHR